MLEALAQVSLMHIKDASDQCGEHPFMAPLLPLGGLGPALTRAALADKPLEFLAATIYGGRPGTPMAPWKAMLSEADALWIAGQLLAGFPEPSKAPR